MTQDKDAQEQQQVIDLYNRIIVLLKEQDADISVAIWAAADIIITCMINAEDGDIDATAEKIDSYLIPMFKDIQTQIKSKEARVSHKDINEIRASVAAIDTGASPVLANMSIQGKKAN